MRYSVGILLTIFGLLILQGPAAAQRPSYNPEKVLDHYLCYEIVAPRLLPKPIPLQIIDQFSYSPPAPAVVASRNLLCNPVNKNNAGVRYPEVHLLCYDLAPVAKPSVRYVANQFTSEEGSELHIVKEAFLCLPTGKTKDLEIRPGDPEAPRAVDHFKCYTVQPTRAVDRVVTLGDQFNKYLRRKVLAPVLLCNPAEKVIRDEQHGPMLNNLAHLVCYQLYPAPRPWAARIPVRIRNQFEEDARLTVYSQPRLLCAPSTKFTLEKG
jgi:hypothetical protein